MSTVRTARTAAFDLSGEVVMTRNTSHLLLAVPEARRILEPLRPRGKGWEPWPVLNVEPVRQAYAIERWYHRGHEMQVMSGIEVSTEMAGFIPATPHYHISISKLRYRDRPKRCSSADARWALEEFGADGALEDNHVPSGIVRNFWMPVAQDKIGKECACTETEPRIVEDKGDYVWRP